MIGCRTFLTAAHCVCLPPLSAVECQGVGSPDPQTLWVFLPQVGLLPVAAVRFHPDYDFPVADLAVLELAESADGVRPAALVDTPTDLGSPGTIVGYGRTSGSGVADFGLLRQGPVVTAACRDDEPDETICWDFTGSGSNTCFGDSGGPLYVGSYAERRLAGSTSGGEATDCLAPDHSSDVDLFRYREWIDSQSTEKAGLTSCGVGAVAASDSAPIQSASGFLVSAEDEAVHSFEVPEGTRELRVGFNGRVGSGTDFRWFVRHGARPDPKDFDCAHDLPRQSGVCRLVDPAPGAWFVLAYSARGGGEYQIAATSFASVQSCGDPDGSGLSTASDALATLRAAVGLIECPLGYCDADGSGQILAADAEVVLRFAVGLVAGLSCPTGD